MIRNIIVPRVLEKSLDELQPALELFRALGASPGREWHEGAAHGFQLEAPGGAVELIAAGSAPDADVTFEVSDADGAWEIAKKHGVKILREIEDTAYGARLFAVEVSGLRVAVITYTDKSGKVAGIEGSLQAQGKRFAVVVSRFNSFITERLLDGTLLALRQAGVAEI